MQPRLAHVKSNAAVFMGFAGQWWAVALPTRSAVTRHWNWPGLARPGGGYAITLALLSLTALRGPSVRKWHLELD